MDEVRLEPKSSGGCWDYIRLYNGATTSSSIIGSYCTTPSYPTVTSSGSSVLVVFKSDGSVNNGKFSISWTFNDGGGPGGGEFSFALVLITGACTVNSDGNKTKMLRPRPRPVKKP